MTSTETTIQHGRKHKRWREHTDVSGTTARWTTATERYNEQDRRSDLHPEAHLSHARKARPNQWKYVVEKIRAIHENDKRPRPINHDEELRNLTTIP